jgi:hypothetical protein
MVLGGTRWTAGLKGLAGVHEILDLDLWQTGRSKAERARWSTWTTLDYEQRDSRTNRRTATIRSC